MLKNFIKLSIRVLLRNKFYSLLNIMGLSLGLACSIIIMLYLQNDLSYDKHYENYDQIYRIGTRYNIEDKEDRFALSQSGIGPLLKEEYPEVENYVRLGETGRILINYEDKKFFEESIMHCDSSYFDIFSHKFISGNPQTCLDNPNSMVLTESLAKKFFGNENPMGKQLKTVANDYQITAVIEDIPDNTHLKFSGLICFHTFTKDNPETAEQWIRSLWGVGRYSYIKLPKNYDTEDFFARFPDFYNKYMASLGEVLKGTSEPILQRLDEVHFGENLQYDRPKGNQSYLYAFISIGVFIMVLACINYMNMATARSADRAKEVGMRKVFGSEKSQLMIQYISESILLTIIALVFALSFVEFTLSATPFNELIGKNLALNFLENPLLFFGSIILCIVVGIFSGMYPAFYLSSIQPVKALKGTFKAGKAGFILRKALVSFQFMISILVVIVTLLMNNQMDYIHSKDLGFDKENVMLVPIRDTLIMKKMPSIKSELLSNPNIVGATTSDMNVGVQIGRNVFRVETDNGMENQVFGFMMMSRDYFETMDIDLLEGETFDDGEQDNDHAEFIINETGADYLGWSNPIGKKIEWGFDNDGNTTIKGTIIGITGDFNTGSLHDVIEPVMMVKQRNSTGSLHLKLKGEDLPQTIAFIKEKWSEFDPSRPLDYTFLDEDIQDLYTNDESQSRLIAIFSYICIFISALGLLGLASFSTEQRTKEIAVRKVMGASVSNIVFILYKDIIYLIIIAALVSFPLAYQAFDYWLQGFAYKVDVAYIIFIFIAFMALLLAFITIAFHTVRAARQNPAQLLKYE